MRIAVLKLCKIILCSLNKNIIGLDSKLCTHTHKITM